MCIETATLGFAEPISELDAPRGIARVASGKPLPAMQAALLHYLRQHVGRTISRDELAEHVWKQRHFHNSRAIDQAVANLRKRLRKNERIVSVWSAGYRLEDRDARATKTASSRAVR
jgi:DNA-binding response OmpR family regulator